MTNPNQDPTSVSISHEIIVKIRTTKEIVSTTVDFEEAQYWAQMLNAELEEDGLIGDTVIIESDNITWTQARLDSEGNLEYTLAENPDVFSPRYARGTFTGAEVIQVEGKNVLIYRGEAYMETDELSTLAFTAPAEESIITRESVNQEDKMTMEEFFTHHVQVLASVRNVKFREDFGEFCDLIQGLENEGSLDADFVREAGVLVTWMLSYDELIDDSEKRQSLIEMLASIMGNNKTFEIYAEEHVTDRIGEGDNALYINSLPSVHFRGPIEAVALVANYEHLKLDGVPVFDGLLQPALVVSINGEHHYLPMKGVEKFSQVRLVSQSTLCKEALARYREQHLQQG